QTLQQWQLSSGNSFALTVAKCTSSGIFIASSENALEHFIPNRGNATTRGGSFNYRGGVYGPYGGCEGSYLANDSWKSWVWSLTLEVLKAKKVEVLKVGTEHNVADALTKVAHGLKLQL
nr:hypothetical protein [Tanacetum cinerariifolium]